MGLGVLFGKSNSVAAYAVMLCCQSIVAGLVWLFI